MVNDSICKSALKASGLNTSQISNLLEVAKSASKKGGDILHKNYGQLTKIENKGRVGDLVTSADLEAEKVVINYLKSETPDIAILAEESGSIGSETNLMWFIDPLDGTTNYAHGYPFFATSVGLCWNNRPLLGAITIPFLKETYFAAPGVGSFCNSEQIQVSKTKKLIDSLLVTGFAYDRHTVDENNYAEFCWLTHNTRGVRRGGAAAVDLAFIASGRLDGYWERGLAKWDLAAGVPLVELAGGVVCNYPDGNFDLNSGRILACNTSLEKELKKELKNVKRINPETLTALASNNNLK
ncbi:inositol monophosphatase family protein [Prochlorococcus sp. MIT 1223]|uniref:inositol monophosphatase family protein n=1 Tax=Prochlorococcus sp. MIT 1223 TaxID=3096217 RepID=UPI002A74D5E9|nr:inositol monophosphatase family protein [Prochlorococcus sp. MIT 1223]